MSNGMGLVMPRPAARLSDSSPSDGRNGALRTAAIAECARPLDYGAAVPKVQRFCSRSVAVYPRKPSPKSWGSPRTCVPVALAR